jgi:hypothetical protein
VAGQIAGYSHLLLPDDPFQGWLVEEISEELLRAREELSELGYLNKGDQLYEGLKEAIIALGAPQKTCLLNRTQAGDTIRTHALHQSDGKWLGLHQPVPNEYKIKFINRRSLAVHILRFLGIEKQKSAPGRGVNLTGQTLQEARRKAREKGKKACVDYLKKSGLERSQIENVAAALSKPIASGSLITLTWERRQAQQKGALAFLEGKGGLFELSELDGRPDWVTLTPRSGNAFGKRIRDLVKPLRESN